MRFVNGDGDGVFDWRVFVFFFPGISAGNLVL